MSESKPRAQCDRGCKQEYRFEGDLPMRSVEFRVVSSGLAMSYTKHLPSVQSASSHRASATIAVCSQSLQRFVHCEASRPARSSVRAVLIDLLQANPCWSRWIDCFDYYDYCVCCDYGVSSFYRVGWSSGCQENQNEEAQPETARCPYAGRL
jgi:hypothetical protein